MNTLGHADGLSALAWVSGHVPRMHTLARLCIKLDMYCGKATIYLTRLEAGNSFINHVESDNEVRNMDQHRPTYRRCAELSRVIYVITAYCTSSRLVGWDLGILLKDPCTRRYKTRNLESMSYLLPWPQGQTMGNRIPVFLRNLPGWGCMNHYVPDSTASVNWAVIPKNLSSRNLSQISWVRKWMLRCVDPHMEGVLSKCVIYHHHKYYHLVKDLRLFWAELLDRFLWI